MICVSFMKINQVINLVLKVTEVESYQNISLLNNKHMFFSNGLTQILLINQGYTYFLAVVLMLNVTVPYKMLIS